MNIYHITFAPHTKIACLHFWGCNFQCKACLCKKEIYDCHLEETKDAIYDPIRASNPPTSFLSLAQVVIRLREIETSTVIFLGQEPTVDPELPGLVKILHDTLNTQNILLTNGFYLPALEDIDEVVLSIKAWDDRIHQQYTGVSNKRVLRNFGSLYQRGIKLQLESVLIPEYIDCPEIEKIAQFIASTDPYLPYRIDAYLQVWGNPWRQPTVQELDKAVDRAKQYLYNVSRLKNKENLLYEIVRVV